MLPPGRLLLKAVALAVPLQGIMVGPVMLVCGADNGAAGAGLEKVRRFALVLKTVFGNQDGERAGLCYAQRANSPAARSPPDEPQSVWPWQVETL